MTEAARELLVLWPRCYIAHAISLGDRQANIHRAVAAGLELMAAKIAAYIPGLNALEGSGFPPCSPGDDAYEQILQADLSFVSTCQAMLRLDVGNSAGADREERFARERKIPIFYSTADVIAFLRLDRTDQKHPARWAQQHVRGSIQARHARFRERPAAFPHARNEKNETGATA